MAVSGCLPAWEVPGAQTTKFNKDHFIKRGVTNSFARTALRWRCFF